MKTVRLKDFGYVISDNELGSRIVNVIESTLKKGEKVEIDFQDVISMATFCSKQIFGHLYTSLTPKLFFEQIKIINASEDMRVIVRLGIEKALEDQSISK